MTKESLKIKINQELGKKSDRYDCYVLPGGDYVSMKYEGSYDGLGAAWGKFMGMMGEKKWEMKEAYEIYPNDPATTPEKELLTIICARRA